MVLKKTMGTVLGTVQMYKKYIIEQNTIKKVSKFVDFTGIC
jgi:hypothetical protein